MALPDSAMGEGRGNEREKQEEGEAGVKRGKRNNREEETREKERKKEFFFVIMDVAGTLLTQHACMFNGSVCQRARALCVLANVSTAPQCSCAHLAWKKRGENNS